MKSLLAVVAALASLCLDKSNGETISISTCWPDPKDGCNLICPEGSFNLANFVTTNGNDRQPFDVYSGDESYSISIPFCGAKSVTQNPPFPLPIGTYDAHSWHHELVDDRESFSFSFRDGLVCARDGVTKMQTVIQLVCEPILNSVGYGISHDSENCIGIIS